MQLLLAASNKPDYLPQDSVAEGQTPPPREYRRDENGKVVYKVDLPLAAGLLAAISKVEKDGKRRIVTASVMHTCAAVCEAMDKSVRDTPQANRALSLSCKLGFHQLVELLIKHKVGLKMACAPEAATSTTSTTKKLKKDAGTAETTKHPLILACLSGHQKVVSALLHSGDVPVDVVLPSGKTPLYLMCARGDADMTKLLLSHRASLDRVTCSGRTALFVAVETDREACVRVLAQRLENYHLVATNHAGVAPIALAEKRGNTGVILPLLDAYRQNVLRNSLDTSNRGKPAANVSCGYCNGLVQKYAKRLEKYVGNSALTTPTLKFARHTQDKRRPEDSGRFLKPDDDPFVGRNTPKPKFKFPTAEEIAEAAAPVRLNLTPPPAPLRTPPRRNQDLALELEQIRRAQFNATLPASSSSSTFRHGAQEISRHSVSSERVYAPQEYNPPFNFSATMPPLPSRHSASPSVSREVTREVSTTGSASISAVTSPPTVAAPLWSPIQPPPPPPRARERFEPTTPIKMPSNVVTAPVLAPRHACATQFSGTGMDEGAMANLIDDFLDS